MDSSRAALAVADAVSLPAEGAPVRARPSPLATLSAAEDAALWKLVSSGDLSGLNDRQKTAYFLHLCQSLGLNPATAPLEFLRLNGRLVLYAKRTATDQLRSIHGVSLIERPVIEDDGEYITAYVGVRDREGRVDYEIGSVYAGNAGGEARSNATMKALTKAKRRATLSICGLGMLDESEVGSVPGAEPMPVGFPDERNGEAAHHHPSGGSAQTPARNEPTAGRSDDHLPGTPAMREQVRQIAEVKVATGALAPAEAAALVGKDGDGLTRGQLRAAYRRTKALPDPAPGQAIEEATLREAPKDGPVASTNRHAGLHAAIRHAGTRNGSGFSAKDVHALAHDLAVANLGVASLNDLDDEQLGDFVAWVKEQDAASLGSAWELAKAQLTGQGADVDAEGAAGVRGMPGMPEAEHAEGGDAAAARYRQ